MRDQHPDVRFRAHIADIEGGHTDGGTNVNAQVSLPNTQERLKLIALRGLESPTETTVERDVRDVTGVAPGGLEDNALCVGLKALAAKMLGVQLSVEGGVRVRAPPDPCVRLRAFCDFTASTWGHAARRDAAVVER